MRLVISFLVLLLTAPAWTAEPDKDDLKQRLVGWWYGEQVYEEKGMVTQYLVQRLPDGRFVMQQRGRRFDLPERLLDFSLKGKWSCESGKLIQSLEEFTINEKDVSPSGGGLDARDEYTIVSADNDLLVTRFIPDNRTFHSKRVNSLFRLPDLPAPPKPTSTENKLPDKTRFDAYLR